GYPDAALADADNALKIARDIGQAGTLMYALYVSSHTLIHCGNYAAARTLTDQLVELADEKGSLFWLAFGRMNRSCIWALTGKPSDGVQMLTNAINAHRSTGARNFLPWYLSVLSCAYSELGSAAVYCRSDVGGRDNRGTLVRGGGPSHGRRNHAEI